MCTLHSIQLPPHMQKRRVRLSPEEASDLYAEHYGKLFFPSLIAYMSRCACAGRTDRHALASAESSIYRCQYWV